MNDIDLLRRAANGDVDALVEASTQAALAADGSDCDPLIVSIEGMTLARLAALRGDMRGVALLMQHCLKVSQLCSEVDACEIADHYGAEMVALGDVALDHLTTEQADGVNLLGNLQIAVNSMSREGCLAVPLHRAYWAQALAES